jgi:enoyl-CoA hydratase/carnithine racemase
MTETEPLLYRVEDNIAWLTLNRPEVLNAIDARMRAGLRAAWLESKKDPDVRVIVITGAGDRAFTSGADRSGMVAGSAEEGPMSAPPGKIPGGPGYESDLDYTLPPKSVGCFKPVIAAVNGIACGAAFYILGESDIIIAAENATFFDPHVSFGQVSGYESIHMLQRIPIGEVLRMQLMGNYERMSARRAEQIGLVSQVVPLEELMDAAGFVARAIAAQSPDAIAGTLRAIWAACDVSRPSALALAPHFLAMADPDAWAGGQDQFRTGAKREWRLR